LKTKLNDISAIPSKRIYLSIIADYHLHLALCELIDNAIDNWIFNGRLQELEINLDLDYDQQTIKIKDNSGGIKEEDIHLIVSPGQSRETSSDEIIGVFGVGSKRAVVALSKQIKIYTRHSNENTLLVEIDDNWVKDLDNWLLPAFQVDNIDESTTQIELSILREKIEEENHEELLEHFGATYALFLEAGGMKIIINNEKIIPKTFDNWSYPPGYEPQEGTGPIKIKDRENIQVSIIGGLTKSHKEGDSSNEEYGVYFYCNDRLIARAYKGDEVGFNTPFKIGKPHPSLSIARVIVKLKGEVEFMPWNSSKSVIDFKHKTFQEISAHIRNMLIAYASMSRNFEGQWPEKVFQYKTGTIKKEVLTEISREIRIHTPEISRSPKQPKYIDQIKRNNKDLAILKPWVRGHYEAIIIVEEVSKINVSQNNRANLLILDSTLEIAFKDYLINESNVFYPPNTLETIMKARHKVHDEIKKYISFKKGTWEKVKYFYNLRCDLVHKRISADIKDEDLENFRDLVEYMLKKMFRLNFDRS
jgi:hypothetical protein|tara:strand:+ start:36730 stop:38325 length:1596 start_codon:yes stop_codon:yes gene_type:complete